MDKQANISPEIKPILSNEDILEYTSSLWKYKVIDENEPNSHDESYFQSIQLSSGKLYGARVRGKKHKHEGTNCDDWFCIDNIDNWILITVSDGAGSKKYSRIGAKLACESSIKYIKEELYKIKESDEIKDISLPIDSKKFSDICSILASIVQGSIIKSYEAIEENFNKYKDNEQFIKPLNRDLEIKDFSCTLLVMVAIPVIIDKNLQHLIITCQIGDGVLACIDVTKEPKNMVKLLSQADKGEFAGETDFITSPQMNKIETLMKRTKITRQSITCLMAMTDGVADDYYPNNPEILRLYIDLKLNGIIDFNSSISKENIELIKMIPKPIKYPWINNQDISFSIQYADKVMSSTNLTLEQLLENSDIINSASLKAFNCALNYNDKKDETLKIWLDNYTQRGSFDDRTLIIFHT